LGDVARLARRALESARLQRDLLAETGVTVEEMIAWLDLHLGAGAVEAAGLLSEAPSGPVAFLAMLEMARTGRLRIEQREPFGTIEISVGR
jgi:chromatin segregation and condensation protein Rec8/ScpA/Scc1 (kleisin family)